MESPTARMNLMRIRAVSICCLVKKQRVKDIQNRFCSDNLLKYETQYQIMIFEG